jgi:hypothetical protein
MPRLKPPPTKELPPIVEDHEEPVGEVVIALPDDGLGPAEIDLATPPTTETKPAPPKKEEPEDSPLAKALADQQRAEELQRTTQRERDEALAREREQRTELERERGDREDAQYNSVLTAIAAEQSTIAKAEQEYAAHANAGDWTAAAAAQRIMVSAAARLDRLEDGKQAFETKRETKPPPRSGTPAAAAAPASFEQKIAPLPPAARDWLRLHPEFINDDSMNRKINAFHNHLVENEGVSQFSPAYFDAVDARFGFKTAPAAPQPQRRSTPVAAPVSREVPTSAGTRQGLMTLTEEERKIARLSIMDRPDMPNLTNEQKEYIYAQNKRKLHAMRANGSYRQTTEQTG